MLILQAIIALGYKRVWLYTTIDSLCTYTEENLEFLDTPVHTLHVHVVTMHEYETIMTVLIAGIQQITVLPMQALYEMLHRSCEIFQ